MFEKFLSHFSKDLNEMWTGLSEKYKDQADFFNVIKDRYNYLFNPENLNEELNAFVANSSDLEKDFFGLVKQASF